MKTFLSVFLTIYSNLGGNIFLSAFMFLDSNCRYLNSYFKLHACLSFRTCVPKYVCTSHFISLLSIPAGASHNVNVKSFFACLKCEQG